MATGALSIDNVDMNEVLYRYEIPRREAYNLHAQAAFRNLFCQDVDEGYYRFPVEGFKMQELGPMGKPIPQKQVWGKKQRDVRKFGVGFAYSVEWVARARSMDEVLEAQKRCFEADENLVNAMVLDAIMSVDSYYGLVNTRYAVTEPISAPPSYGQNSFASTHTHYLTTGTSSLSTLTPLTAAKKHILEHGHNGPFIAFINSENLKDIEDMAKWTAAAQTPVANPVLDKIATDGFARRMLGIDWVVSEHIPADYIVIVSAPVAKQLVAFVQFDKSAFQGLVLLSDQQPLTRNSTIPVGSYPLINSYYLRWCNTYVLLRTAAVVIKVTTGSFDNPDVVDTFLMSPTQTA